MGQEGGFATEGRRGWIVELSGHWMVWIGGRRCGDPIERPGKGELANGNGAEAERGRFVSDGPVRCGWRVVLMRAALEVTCQLVP